ncbi:hypothetical protein KKG29_02270 [Patescibacteria group bacterium]|nr:hypothetical protein [Patescibacteria group bacterium]MBU3999982.1 hypothetical protein [Patescibacteria group bacterium]MBU4056935.1 hypothetical protein [Patescibacteria group bacterium]MBU4368798.1 hypothetical protein [Patescibacteria group bacterium]
MIPYQTKIKKLPGTSYGEVVKHAYFLFNQIKKKTKRRPYIKSAYFDKQKIFFDYFLEHLFQKSPKERLKRLKYFGAALELMRKSKNHPTSEENPHKKGEILHRFAGLTTDRELFYAQIKEEKRNGKKYFMSCFPEN